MILRSAVLVLGVLLLHLGFVLGYIGAFHAPMPRDISIAVVAPSLAPAGTAEEVAEQLNLIEGTPSMRARSAQRATRGGCWPTATSTACS